MGKIKLLVLIAVSVLSVYVLSKVSTAAPTATDSTLQRLPVSTPKHLATEVATISPADLAKIRAGTFTTVGPTGGMPCPVTPNCGTANTVPTLYGTASCPNVCYVRAVLGAAPPAGLPSYPVCPSGYATVNPGEMDVLYKFSSALSVFPPSIASMTNYQTLAYVCVPDPTVQFQECQDPYHTSTGDLEVRSGRVYKAVYTECRANCSWGASSCGVAHVLGVTWQAMKCTRPAGNYPVAAQYNPSTGTSSNYYQSAPTSIICGHIRTQWK